MDGWIEGWMDEWMGGLKDGGIGMEGGRNGEMKGWRNRGMGE